MLVKPWLFKTVINCHGNITQANVWTHQLPNSQITQLNSIASRLLKMHEGHLFQGSRKKNSQFKSEVLFRRVYSFATHIAGKILSLLSHPSLPPSAPCSQWCTTPQLQTSSCLHLPNSQIAKIIAGKAFENSWRSPLSGFRKKSTHYQFRSISKFFSAGFRVLSSTLWGIYSFLLPLLSL